MLPPGWPRFSLTGLVTVVLVVAPGWHSLAEGTGLIAGTVRPAEHDGSLQPVQVRQTGPEAAPAGASRFSPDTAFIERSSEPFGTFDGVSFVRYTGIFRGETSLGAFRVPYEIVAPENPGLGNGTVLVEPPHFGAGTAGRDRVLGPDLLFGNGYSYASVGFGENGRNILEPTASDLRLAGEPVQAPGALALDPAGTLDEEILGEFSEALTSDPFAAETLGPVDRLYAYGVSQTAAVLLELRRAVAGTERAGLFDFTLLHVAVWQAPLPDTAQFDLLRGEFEPLEGLGRVIFVESEGDLVVSSAEQFRKAVGEPDFRVYEVAGAAHGRSEHNSLDHHAVARAMFVAGDRWTRTGVEPPPSTLLEEAPAGRVDPVYEFETGIARDDDLNARGGVRLPDLHLGRARFVASDSTTRSPGLPPRFAFLYGSTIDLPCQPAPGSDTDEPRFRTHEDYVDAFTRQVDELQRQGFLLEADAVALKERAAGSEVGKPGTCDR